MWVTGSAIDAVHSTATRDKDSGAAIRHKGRREKAEVGVQLASRRPAPMNRDSVHTLRKLLLMIFTIKGDARRG